jgi:bifunctional ADP-heptose synthase (sugar kinase/adenylyltransferase)
MSISSRHEISERIHLLRAGGDVGRVVLANGCFDLLHPGLSTKLISR